MHIEEKIEIKSISYFSISHIQSVALFCRKLYKIENEYDGSFDLERIMEHKTYVINAVISAVAFLEANINELFIGANQSKEMLKRNPKTKNLDKEIIDAFSKSWDKGIPRTANYSVPEKYSIALDLAEKEKFNKGDKLYQNIRTLVTLRNELVHYEPEWVLSNTRNINEIHKMGKKLKGKFKLNPLTSKGNPFYPDKCLSYGCAEWALSSSVDFVDEFSKKIGIKPKFDHVRDTLNPR